MKRFLLAYGLALAFLLAATAAFNVFVDADALFGAPRVEGLNARKTQWFYRTQTIKPISMGWRKPHGLILGSSRAANGLRVKFLPWDTINAYNAASEGATIYTDKRLYQHAQAVSGMRVKKVLLTLDFYGFNDALDRNDPGSFFNAALNQVTATRPNGAIKKSYGFDLLDQTLKEALTLKAIQRSIKTIRTQSTSTRNLYEDGAFVEPTNPEFSEWTRYMRVVKSYMKGKGGWFKGPQHRFRMRPRGVSLQSYRQLLASMYQSHTHSVLAIDPLSAGVLVAIHTTGLWPCFQRWKRSLVAINRAVAKQFGAKPFPLWDFAYAASPTMEPVPHPGDKKSKMRYWDDASHYSPVLGHKMATRMYRPSATRNKNTFGVRLNSINIDNWLAHTRDTLKKIHRRLPRVTAAIRKMAIKALPEKKTHISCPVNLNTYRQARPAQK